MNTVVGSSVVITDPIDGLFICAGKIVMESKGIVTLHAYAIPSSVSPTVIMSVRSYSNEFYACTADVVSVDNNVICVTNVAMITRKDRRLSERYALELPALVVSRTWGIDFDGVAMNISNSGILLEADAELPVDDRLSIQIPFYAESSVMDILSCNADIVRYGIGHSKKFSFGCRFGDLDSFEYSKLRKYISTQKKFFRKNIL